METLKAIEERRSIRHFLSDDISKDTVEDIINCGRLAPSAKNRQPWYFIVLKGDVKNKVADMMIQYANNKSNSNTDLYRFSSIIPSANVIKAAPVLILVFWKKEEEWLISDSLSIGACVENMCLRAYDLNLGSLWLRDVTYVSEKIENLLGVNDLKLNCAVSIGVPIHNPKQRPRNDLKDIVKWY